MNDVQVLLTIEEAAKALRIGRTTVYELLSNGSLASVHIGRAHRISLDAIRDYVRENESRSAA